MPADRPLHDAVFPVPAGDTGVEADGPGAGGCGGGQAGGDVRGEILKIEVLIMLFEPGMDIFNCIHYFKSQTEDLRIRGYYGYDGID